MKRKFNIPGSYFESFEEAKEKMSEMLLKAQQIERLKSASKLECSTVYLFIFFLS